MLLGEVRRQEHCPLRSNVALGRIGRRRLLRGLWHKGTIVLIRIAHDRHADVRACLGGVLDLRDDVVQAHVPLIGVAGWEVGRLGAARAGEGRLHLGAILATLGDTSLYRLDIEVLVDGTGVCGSAGHGFSPLLSGTMAPGWPPQYSTREGRKASLMPTSGAGAWLWINGLEGHAVHWRMRRSVKVAGLTASAPPWSKSCRRPAKPLQTQKN